MSEKPKHSPEDAPHYFNPQGKKIYFDRTNLVPSTEELAEPTKRFGIPDDSDLETIENPDELTRLHSTQKALAEGKEIREAIPLTKRKPTALERPEDEPITDLGEPVLRPIKKPKSATSPFQPRAGETDASVFGGSSAGLEQMMKDVEKKLQEKTPPPIDADDDEPIDLDDEVGEEEEI